MTDKQQTDRRTDRWKERKESGQIGRETARQMKR